MKPTLLTREEWWHASSVGISFHYDLVPVSTADFFEVEITYDRWCKTLEQFPGSDMYEKHVSWYNVRFSKLNMSLK